MVEIDLDGVSLDFKVRRFKHLTLKEFLVRGLFKRESVRHGYQPALRNDRQFRVDASHIARNHDGAVTSRDGACRGQPPQLIAIATVAAAAAMTAIAAVSTVTAVANRLASQSRRILKLRGMAAGRISTDIGSSSRAKRPESDRNGPSSWRVLLRGGGQHAGHQQNAAQRQPKQFRGDERQHTPGPDHATDNSLGY